MRSVVLMSVAAATVMAGGYKIPESSINATALGAAYVANAYGADAAYYNPAAMVYNDDANQLEIDATYIGLSSIHYASASGVYNIDSKSESFLVPTLHYTSKKLGDNGARVGLSIVVPAGLSKRWTSAPAVYSAEEFTLKTLEVNPSFAVALSDTVSIGAGFRMVRTDGVVKSTSPLGSRDMDGSSTDYGYNLALNYRPLPNVSFAATYRSKIDLTIEGNAKLYAGLPAPANLAYNGAASVKIPVPGALNLAAAYTFDTGTTLEAVYERTYWSSYKNLDFNYALPIGGAFDNPIPKNWRDTNSYRLGLTQKLDQWTAMAALAYDQTPVPESTLGYELPDSNAWLFSLGGRYQIDKQWNVGIAGLVDVKGSRDVNNAAINGEFSNARAYLVTAGIEYRF